MVTLEKIVLSGCMLTLKPPLIVKELDVVEIRANGLIVWQQSGHAICKIHAGPEIKNPPKLG